MTDLPIINLLPWDSAFFGYPVARLLPARVDAAVLREAFAWCRQQQVRCLYYLAAADAAASLQAAQAAGMCFVDVRMTLARPLPPADQPLPAPRHAVRPATPADQPGLLALAPVLADVSRFGRDPHFGREQAIGLYEAWLMQETAVTLVIDSPPDSPAAIAGAIGCASDAHQTGTISLLATHPHSQGQGIGRALCAAGLRWMQAQGCTAVQVVTQGHNIASQRVYQRAGFLTQSAEIWFHKWFDAYD